MRAREIFGLNANRAGMIRVGKGKPHATFGRDCLRPNERAKAVGMCGLDGNILHRRVDLYVASAAEVQAHGAEALTFGAGIEFERNSYGRVESPV